MIVNDGKLFPGEKSVELFISWVFQQFLASSGLLTFVPATDFFPGGPSWPPYTANHDRSTRNGEKSQSAVPA